MIVPPLMSGTNGAPNTNLGKAPGCRRWHTVSAYLRPVLFHVIPSLDLQAIFHSADLFALRSPPRTTLSNLSFYFQTRSTAAFKTVLFSKLFLASRAINSAACTALAPSHVFSLPAWAPPISRSHTKRHKPAPILRSFQHFPAHTPTEFLSQAKTSTTTTNAPSPSTQSTSSTPSKALTPFSLSSYPLLQTPHPSPISNSFFSASLL